MTKKNGFVFIETIIVIVFLMGALLLIYGSYRSAITEEKTKIYYDDIGYLYRNYYLADFLINKTTIHNLKNTAFDEKYVVDINNDIYEELFNESQSNQNYPEEFKSIEEEFNVNKMLFVSDEVITECFNNATNEKCDKSYEGLSDGLTKYIETMEIEKNEEDAGTTYYLIAEYRERSTEEGIKSCDENEENCQAFYVTLKLDINKKIEQEGSSIGEICKNQRFGECLKDNYKVENNEEGGIYYHDGDGEDSGNGEKEAGDNSYRYSGKVNNYICYGKNEGECPEEDLYRIIGVINNKIRIIKRSDSDNKWNSVETKGDSISSYAEKWQNMVENERWYIDGIENSSIEKDAKRIYQEEIKGTTKNSKVGLMYVSDYLYGALPKYWQEKGSNYSVAKDSNWLYETGTTQWTVSKVRNTETAVAINNVGNVGVNPVGTNSLSKRVINLKETVILIGGSGTESDPYRITDTGVIIKDLTAKEDFHSLDVEAEAESLEGKIVKYYFSIDGGTTWYEEDENKHTFGGLESNKEYEVKVKAMNNRGNYSEEYSEKFKTKEENPSVKIELVSKGTHNIKVRATATIPVGNLTKYEYQIGTGAWQAVNSNVLTNEKDFTNLNSNTNYTIKVRVTDSNGKVSEEASIDVKTDYENPSVKLELVSEGMYNIDVKATATAGSGAIKSYEYQISPNSTWQTVNSSALTNNKSFTNLLKNTKYTIKVRVVDVNGERSTEVSIEAKTTDFVPPTVTIAKSSGSHNSLGVKATATKGTGDITKYVFTIKKANETRIIETKTVTTSNLNAATTFSNLDYNTSYTINVTVTDSNGLPGSAETTISTDNIKAPTVTLSLSSTYSSINAIANVKEGSGSIKKYEFRIDNGRWIDNGTNKYYTFSGLDPYTKYTIYVRVTDTYTNVTTYDTIRTQPLEGPTVYINSSSSTENTITVKVYGYEGSAPLSKYEFYINGNLWGTKTAISNTQTTYTFSGLTPSRDYTIRVRLIDSNGNDDDDSETITTKEEEKEELKVGIIDDSSCSANDDTGKAYYDENGQKIEHGKEQGSIDRNQNGGWEWIASKKGWYYIKDGCIKKGWIWSNQGNCKSQWYFTNNDKYSSDYGKMLTGWQKLTDSNGTYTYYLDLDGTYQAQGCMVKSKSGIPKDGCSCGATVNSSGHYTSCTASSGGYYTYSGFYNYYFSGDFAGYSSSQCASKLNGTQDSNSHWRTNCRAANGGCECDIYKTRTWHSSC